MEYLLALICWIVLMLLHELGHIVFGWAVGYKFQALNLSPGTIFPHVVMEARDEEKWRRKVYLIGGFSITICLFGLYYISGFSSKAILLVFIIQMAVETNPFFSDLAMLIFYREGYERANDHFENLKQKIREQWFTPKWYAHLGVWLLGLIVLSRYFIQN
jgi:membrane-associated protease RseP (regulator of RpoE activity)